MREKDSLFSTLLSEFIVIDNKKLKSVRINVDSSRLQSISSSAGKYHALLNNDTNGFIKYNLHH